MSLSLPPATGSFSGAAEDQVIEQQQHELQEQPPQQSSSLVQYVKTDPVMASAVLHPAATGEFAFPVSTSMVSAPAPGVPAPQQQQPQAAAMMTLSPVKTSNVYHLTTTYTMPAEHILMDTTNAAAPLQYILQPTGTVTAAAAVQPSANPTTTNASSL